MSFEDLKKLIRQEAIDKLEAEFDLHHVRCQLAENKIEKLRDEIELERDRQRLKQLKGD
jgi:hypothetical protein